MIQKIFARPTSVKFPGFYLNQEVAFSVAPSVFIYGQILSFDVHGRAWVRRFDNAETEIIWDSSNLFDANLDHSFALAPSAYIASEQMSLFDV